MFAVSNTVYFVTDVEADGPNPSENSMLSFATVACSVANGITGHFQAVLEPRLDRAPNEQTMAWWQTQPLAYIEATRNPVPPKEVIEKYANWVEAFPNPRIFVAAPLSFDGGWIDEYFNAFLSTRLVVGPMKTRRVFDGFAVDLPSYIAGLFGWEPGVSFENIHKAPAWWRGDIQHTHKALDDAMGYANILLKALEISAQRPHHEQDFMRHQL
jgi:DNA polymerase III alpha subunit (gram-positive type)